MKNESLAKAVPVAAIVLFLAGAAFLFWRETSQVNLKAGIRMYEENRPEAVEVLRGGVKKNGYNYLLHYYLALAIQNEVFDKIEGKSAAKFDLAEAKESLQKALLLRRDPFDHRALAHNFELSGKVIPALAHYNISFFFSLDAKETKRWQGLRSRQGEAAEHYFNRGETGVSLMMVYNHLARFKINPPQTPSVSLIRDFFFSIPPDRWIASGEEAKKELIRIFDSRTPEEKRKIGQALTGNGFAFLAEFLDKE